MTNKPEKPDEDELLAFLDEELTPERQAEIRQMLAANWELRAQLARLEKRIELYVEATAPRASIATPPVDDLWQDFSDRLSRTTLAPAASARFPARLQSFTARLAEWGQRNQSRTLRLAIGAALSLLLIAAFILLKPARTVSARELLERAAQAEAASLRRVGDPVVYRKIQVKRSGAQEAVVWESWNDARRSQFRQRVAHTQEKPIPAIVAELAQILQANQLDARQPLSAAAYAAWRKTIRPQAESVVEIALPGSAAGLKLTTVVSTPVADNQIIEATFLVRRADWHAVALHLKVQRENEIRSYELSELAYEVLPLEALTDFAALAPTPALTPALTPSIVATASPAASPTSVPTVAPSAKPLPAEAELQEAEVAALYALHQAQADLGEQIEVVREAHGVTVRGLVERAERQRQLIDALRGLPLVTPQIQTVAEAARQMATQPPARPLEQTTISEPPVTAPAANAFQQRLERYFVERGYERQRAAQQATQLANAAIAEAARGLAEAWALRRLAERFTAEKQRDFAPDAQARIDEMARQYLARLRATSGSLRARLEPILTSLSGTQTEAMPPRADTTWQAQALAVFNAARQVNQLAGRLFAETAAEAVTSEQAAQHMLAALTRLDHALRSFKQERQLNSSRSFFGGKQ